jgi:Uma2 family endonuclease
MSTQPISYFTPQQYLEMERKAEFRSEYFHGEIFPMSAASLNYSRIFHSLSSSLYVQLRGRSCEIAGSNLLLQVSPDGLYTYPDILVFCAKPQFADSHSDMITDAMVIIEVLSPSTENYDRAFKFEQYRRLPSLKDYIVIAQDRIYLEHHTPQADRSWRLEEITDPAAVVSLNSIGCTFRVAEVYERVTFGATPE